MNDYEEESYRRYKQYRINKYTYEQEQKTFPISVILFGALLMSIWKYILLGIAIIGVGALLFFILDRHFSMKMNSVQKIVLSSEEARDGIEINATISNIDVPKTIVLKIPPRVKNGQKYIARNVEIQKDSEKKKVNIYFTIEIKD